MNTASEKVTSSKSNRKRLKTDVKREKNDRIDEEQDSDMTLIEYYDDNVADPDFNVEECEEDSDVTIIEDDDDNNVVKDYDNNIADSDFDAEEYAKTIKIEKTHFKMEKKPYTTTCPTCRKECGTRKAFRHHVETVHTQAICDYCGNSYKGYTTLKRHIRAIHKEVKHYKCTIEGCEARFNFHHSLKLHILKHTGERPHVCSVCGKSYLTSDHLKAHFQAIHTNIKNFICRFCGESFSYPGSHNIHERRHIGKKDRRFPCEQCEKTFATRHVLECHVMTKHTTGGHHTCDICHKVYKTEYTLKMHQHYHTQDKQRFMCDTCGKGFMYKSVLKLHKYVHINDKNFKCMTCGKCFKTYPTLSTHNRLVHNDDHPFECSICKKAFKTKVSCKTHERTHSGL